MIRILINQCNQMIRKGKFETTCAEFPDIVSEESQYAILEFKELLDGMDEKYRVIMILFYVEGFKISEISELLEMQENTVKTRLRRGRNSLKKVYDETNLRGAEA